MSLLTVGESLIWLDFFGATRQISNRRPAKYETNAAGGSGTGPGKLSLSIPMLTAAGKLC
jgi:hypothetical protein